MITSSRVSSTGAVIAAAVLVLCATAFAADLSEGNKRKTRVAGGPLFVALVIDDLGVDVPRTRDAIALDPAVSLSFLPYPLDSVSLSHQAHVAGHKFLIHMPMEPEGKEDPGPLALREGLLPSELSYRVQWMFARVSDFSGANNHMGSKFTASRAALAPVMRELGGHVQFFLDSRTTAKSQAVGVARAFGLVSGQRDVFLDDEQAADAVERQLLAMEAFARTHGSVIAIGHPHGETLDAIKTWVKNARARGFRLVSVGTLLHQRSQPAGATHPNSLAASRG